MQSIVWWSLLGVVLVGVIVLVTWLVRQQNKQTVARQPRSNLTDVRYLAISLPHREARYFTRLERLLHQQGVTLEKVVATNGKSLDFHSADLDLHPQHRHDDQGRAGRLL